MTLRRFAKDQWILTLRPATGWSPLNRAKMENPWTCWHPCWNCEHVGYGGMAQNHWTQSGPGKIHEASKYDEINFVLWVGILIWSHSRFAIITYHDIWYIMLIYHHAMQYGSYQSILWICKKSTQNFVGQFPFDRQRLKILSRRLRAMCKFNGCTHSMLVAGDILQYIDDSAIVFVNVDRIYIAKTLSTN